jgi:cytochrome b6-f complex iron-sulfur subunit
MATVSRRDFLKMTTTTLLSISGLLGLAGLFRYLDFQEEDMSQTEFDLGLASDYPPGSRSLIADVPAILIHEAGGFKALSLICTHLGCTVEQKDDGFACPCHGSRYNAEGQVTRGPAPQALRVLRVEQTPQGHLVLHTN